MKNTNEKKQQVIELARHIAAIQTRYRRRLTDNVRCIAKAARLLEMTTQP